MRISKLFPSILVVLSTALSFGTASHSAAPHRCVNTPVTELARSSKAVFAGQVIDVRESGEVEEVRFKILKSWKYVRGNEVVVFNYPHHEAPQYQVGRSYLVFAGGEGGRLTTGMCSGTIDLSYAQKEIRQLDRWWRRNKSRRR
jgi:hypothetical protein